MGEIDFAKMLGVTEEDRELWEKMEAAAKRRQEREGGIERPAKEGIGPALNLAQQAAESRLRAAQAGARDDARTTRRRRTVVEHQTEFLDDDPQF